jgi:MYXO-CTERM domain-containing protein
MTPLILAGAAMAGPTVTGELGGDTSSDIADWSYKTDVVLVDRAVRLLHIAPRLRYAPATGIDELYFVVYEESAANDWTLVWDSGLQAVGNGIGFKASPEIDLLLTPGNRYALGWYMPDGNYEYWFDDPAALTDLGWGVFEGAVWSAENATITLPDSIPNAAPDDHGYLMQVQVEVLDVDGDGATEDVDCDDEDPDLYPGAPEHCDGLDEDCDGVADNDVVYQDGWADADADGYGDPLTPAAWCEREPPDGVVLNDLDCDDGDPAVNPDGVEVCDGADGDCDGEVDEGLPAVTWWTDADADGYGAADGAFEGCDVMPAGAAANGDDCDDGNAARFPGNTELCDGFDNDCSGDLPPVEGDDDADGALNCGDCDPADATVFPGATETCDGIDHDCDGVIPPRNACDPAPGEPLVVASGCGCDAGGGPTMGLAVGLGLLALRRRRYSASRNPTAQ